VDLRCQLTTGNNISCTYCVVLFGSSPFTRLRIGKRGNFGFEGDTDGIEDTDWYDLGVEHISVPWPFLNWAPGDVITSNVT
jgi:hypothetical protein